MIECRRHNDGTPFRRHQSIPHLLGTAQRSRRNQLPAGLPLSIPLLGRTQIGDDDSGFRFGKAPTFTSKTALNMTKTRITFVGDRRSLPAGTYVVRIVVSANNAAPTTHLIRIELTNGMRLQFAKWRERRAIRKADRQAMKGQISRG